VLQDVPADVALELDRLGLHTRILVELHRGA
jgi:hypothetical protein